MSAPLRDTVFLTGGSGFIGTACLARASASKRTVTATTTAAEPPENTETRRWLSWRGGERDVLPSALTGCEAVVHMAAPRDLSGADRAGREAIYDVVVNATQTLLEDAVAQGVQRFVFVSTGDVMGGADGPVAETPGPYDARGFYGAAKAAAEQLVLGYADKLSVAVVRPYHPYGPGGDRFIVNKVVNWIAEGRAIALEGADGIFINPVWIDDLADGIWRAVDSDATGVFHLAGPDIVTFRDMCTTIANLIGTKVTFTDAGRDPVQRHYGAYERARSLLGYAPTVGLRDGLRTLCATSGGNA